MCEMLLVCVYQCSSCLHQCCLVCMSGLDTLGRFYIDSHSAYNRTVYQLAKSAEHPLLGGGGGGGGGGAESHVIIHLFSPYMVIIE